MSMFINWRGRAIWLLILVLILFNVVIFNKTKAEVVEVGQDAPRFTLIDQSGQARSLDDFTGTWLVLYFYPKNDTPGCTKEACAFRDDYKVMVAENIQVLGVSIDDQTSHADFAKKYNLPFPLLADVDGKIAKRYQSLTSLGPLKFAKRHTFIIGPQGKIRKIYRKVDVDNHSKQILADLQSLKSSDL